jgi:uncharacterized membrane protein
MTEFIFMWLEKIGFTHPLHAPVTHIPMGMVMGGCLFALIAHFAKKPALFRTALHCYVVALIAVLPTMFIGYIDWQHFYRGEANPYVIAKICLGTLLFVICGVNVSLLRKDTSNKWAIVSVSAVSFGVAGLLGFFGGELQYGQ